MSAHSSTGQVIAHLGQSVEVKDASNGIIVCHLRQNSAKLVVGDWVNYTTTPEGSAVVTELLERHSLLKKALGQKSNHQKLGPYAANIDQMLVVIATEPAFDELNIDRYLITAELSGIKPAIIFNKSDLLDENTLKDTEERLATYRKLDYPVIYTSALKQDGLNSLHDVMAKKTNIFVGQSGVGKSSLIQIILPDETLAVGKLSTIQQGKHTTSVTRLYELPSGSGKVIDSPGIRELNLWHLPKEELQNGFKEFQPYLHRCKFRDCSHQHEPQCSILQAVKAGHISQRRLDNFHTLVKELESQTNSRANR